MINLISLKIFNKHIIIKNKNYLIKINKNKSSKI